MMVTIASELVLERPAAQELIHKLFAITPDLRVRSMPYAYRDEIGVDYSNTVVLDLKAYVDISDVIAVHALLVEYHEKEMSQL
jgi:hypothetical protein